MKTTTNRTITMRTIRFENRNHCLAQAPNIKEPTDKDGWKNLKSIVWKLSASAVDGKPVEFADGSGIVVHSDPDKQIDKTKQGYGEGSGGPHPPTDPDYIKTMRDKLGAKSSDLPVIAWNPGPDAERCAAADPRIVHTP